MIKSCKIIVVLICLFLLFGCEKEKISEDIVYPEEYCFVYDGLTINPGSVFTRELYGIELEYSEVASCAFEGLDKTFKYEHYEITTYEENNNDIILSIYFLDSYVKTTEGIGLGDSYDDMIEIYGSNYSVNGIEYTYNIDKVNLVFLIENNFITSIEYKYVN